MKGAAEKPYVAILTVAFLLFAMAWGVWRSQYTYKGKVNYLEADAGASSPTGRSVTPEQRLRYAYAFKEKFRDKGVEVMVRIDDVGFHTLTVTGNRVERPLVHQMAGNKELMQDLREKGFKHLVMSNDSVSWVVDLKN